MLTTSSDCLLPFAESKQKLYREYLSLSMEGRRKRETEMNCCLQELSELLNPRFTQSLGGSYPLKKGIGPPLGMKSTTYQQTSSIFKTLISQGN
jgi:hypothetical protein